MTTIRFGIVGVGYIGKKYFPFLAAVFILAGNLPAQEINNADFAKGKTGWQGDGKVVYLAADGTISDKTPPANSAAKNETTTALRIDLSKTDWQEIRQRLSAKAADTEINIAVQVLADPAFKRLPESRKYTSDFSEGGQWVWSALVYPKCDFLIRVKDNTWYYRPLSLSPAGQWKTYTANFPNLKERQREISLLFPPGTGYVLLKGK